MFLVLCSMFDQSALWVHEQLRRSAVAPLDLVTTESLSYARWNYRLESFGDGIRINLPDGHVIDGNQIKGVLNRIATIGSDQANRATPADRDYALSELNAFYLSWLHSLPGAVINRATPQGLCGRWRHPSEWVSLAHKAGLPVRTYRQSEQDALDQAYSASLATEPGQGKKAIVFGERVFGGELPPRIASASVKLAQLAGLDLMGLDFDVGPNGDLLFTNASPLPDLFAGGEELVKAFTHFWRAKGGTV